MSPLYPIIRRFRRPLLPAEAPPAPAPVPPPPVEPPPPEIPSAGADNTEPLLVLAASETASPESNPTAKGKKPCPKKTSAA